tara:strand:- start:2940 stop:3524 length:585 start_codon:yes stop_codon:yes gene_type:complete
MSRIYGYARTSTQQQKMGLEDQIQKLNEAGCRTVFNERISSRKPASERPQLQAVLTVLEESDTLCLTRLDRLARTMQETICIMQDLQDRGVYVRTLDGLIDTEKMQMMAPLVVGLLAGLSNVERNLIAERQRESVEYRRRTNGNLGGRPMLDKVKVTNIKKLRREGNSLRKIVTLTGVSLSAVQRACKEEQAVV